MTRRSKVAITVFAATIPVAVFCMLTIERRSEFSPERLRFRGATVYLGILTRSGEEYTSDFCEFLRQFDQGPVSTPSNWYLCKGSKIGLRGLQGPAILMSRLSNGAYLPNYKEWTSQHPVRAAILWKNFLALIRCGRFIYAQAILFAATDDQMSDEQLLQLIESIGRELPTSGY